MIVLLVFSKLWKRKEFCLQWCFYYVLASWLKHCKLALYYHWLVKNGKYILALWQFKHIWRIMKSSLASENLAIVNITEANVFFTKCIQELSDFSDEARNISLILFSMMQYFLPCKFKTTVTQITFSYIRVK